MMAVVIRIARIILVSQGFLLLYDPFVGDSGYDTVDLYRRKIFDPLTQRLITDKQARKLHVGGEVLAFVW